MIKLEGFEMLHAIKSLVALPSTVQRKSDLEGRVLCWHRKSIKKRSVFQTVSGGQVKNHVFKCGVVQGGQGPMRLLHKG